MNVYLLLGDPDHYWYLEPVDEEDREFSERRHAFIHNPPQPQAANWTPVRMKVYKGPRGKLLEPDFTDWFGVPAVFTERAVEALGDILTSNGELLPLDTNEGGWFAYNTLTVLDALDEERSVVSRLSNGAVYDVREYVFHPERLQGATIFRIPQTPRVLVTGTFKELVEAAGLRGIRCSPVWPDENQPTVRKSRRK
jgi:hypothetical protein